jgi:3'(2'), 5'-bisphosphate nucleotidase
MKFSSELDLAIKASLKAGEVVMDVYNSKEFNITSKEDNSPLTLADKLSNKVILDELSASNIPVLSEESKQINYNVRCNWQKLWIIDPIDGTKEFIKKNGEFTINIALINNSEPTIGVVYVPANKSLYFAEKKLGSFLVNNISSFEDIKKSNIRNLSIKNDTDVYTIVVSRSHMNEETKQYVQEKMKKFKNVETKSFGSSLKICKIADGSANCYPRFGPTMEWDTAAAHCIAEISGCKIFNAINEEKIFYNKENLLNPFFIVEK